MDNIVRTSRLKQNFFPILTKFCPPNEVFSKVILWGYFFFFIGYLNNEVLLTIHLGLNIRSIFENFSVFLIFDNFRYLIRGSSQLHKTTLFLKCSL